MILIDCPNRKHSVLPDKRMPVFLRENNMERSVDFSKRIGFKLETYQAAADGGYKGFEKLCLSDLLQKP